MLIGAAFAVLLSVLLLFGDWFVVALLDLLDWPPDKTSPWLTSPLRAGFSIWIWVPVTLAIACFVGLSTWLNELLTITHPSTEAGPDWPSASHWTIVSIATVLGSCLALPSAVVYYQLVTPLPIPDQHIPEPNGYDDFRAAWALLGANLLVDSGNFDVRTSSTAQLRKAVDQVLPSLERARVGIFRSVMFPIDYTRRSDIYLDDMQQMRSLSRGFQAQGNLFIREQDFTGAMTTFLDAIDYGIHARTGGLIVNELVGIACAGVGRSDLYHVREEMTAKQSRQAIERLATALANVEPHEQFGHRDRVWTQQVDGWFGHLLQLLTELTGDYRFMDPADFGKPYLDEQAVMRLLIVELALQAHLLEHGQLPNELAELVPDYLPNVPLDPLSADSSPLNYRRTEDGYVLYSVGHNGIDDGGTGPQLDENGWSDDTTGDLRLDVIFAPYEEETENTAEDAEESAKTEQ